MVDFTKKIRNSNKFRTPCLHYKEHGVYTFAPVGTTEYLTYWDTESKRCINGYTAPDGDWISGYNYFYLNYCPIQRIVEEKYTDRYGVEKVRRVKDREFPDFYDYDYYFFMAVQEAEDQGKHLVVLKSRRKGYSFKCGSMMNRNYYLIPESKSYAYAAENEFLIKDGIITKSWEFMDFIDEHTAWAKKRQAVNTKMHRRASILTTDEMGNKIEVGYKSEVIGVTIKNDANKIRGKSGRLILFEEAGKSPNLAEAWQVARPSVEQDGMAYGLMIAFGTGGTEGADFSGLRDMFYHPLGYNCLGFVNIWDDNATSTECGFFIPQYTNIDSNGKYMDKDGNTKTQQAKDYILELRNDVINNATASSTVDRYIAEQCITPAEACLELTGNIFPKKDLQEQLSAIRVNKKLQSHKQCGELVFINGELQWQITKNKDIIKYPLSRDDNTAGSIVIWEHPNKENSGQLYIAGNDPYDQDKAGTNSLGSTFIYKRFQNFEEYYDIIVAEYTGRPDTAEDYYENVRKLLMYYNARMLYENERKGLFVYFTQKHSDYLLADQPDIINDIIGKSSVQRRKGIHMNTQIKDYGEGLIKEWLNEEYSPGKKNLTRILSEPLLEELIQYNDKGNFDRVIALMMIMIYKQQLHNIHVKKKDDDIRKNRLFDKPLFSKDWFETSNGNSINEIINIF